jgi:tetratricopeptide (TPR) repeat protein
LEDCYFNLRADYWLAVCVICLSLCGLCILESTPLIDLKGAVALYRIQVLSSQKHYEEAAISLKAFVKQHPENAVAYAQLAVCEAQSGDTQAFGDDLNKALQLDPKNDLALSLSVYKAFKDGDYDRCLQIGSKIPVASAYYKVNKSYYAARIDGIRGHLDQALAEADTEPATADKTKMEIYSQASVDSKAVEIADGILKRDASNPEALYVLLRHSWREMDYKEVMRLAKIVCSTTPPDAQTQSYTSFLYTIAAEMIDDNHPDSLLTQYQTAIGKNDWTKSIRDYFANRMSEKQLIERASDRGQKTEAYAYSGLNLLAHHHPAEAKPYLTWVMQNGVANFFEYLLCESALKNLGSESKSSH